MAEEGASGLNWKNEAIEDLRIYRLRKMSLDELERQEADCDRRLRSARAAAEQGGTDADDRLVGLLARRERLRANRRYVREWVAELEKGLAVLSEQERAVLWAFYVEREPGHVEALCERLAMEKSAVYKLKDTALKRFTLARYGVVEG